MRDREEQDFDANSAEVFEALGHPNRIRILKALSAEPLGFSQLKREVGMESSGLLSFHLQKLGRFVKSDTEGNYALTDEGKEALRVADAIRNHVPNRRSRRLVSSPNIERLVIVALLIGLVAIGGAAAYQQGQISGLSRSNASTSRTTTTATTAPLVFNYSSIPSQFFIGNYSVSVVQGVGYVIPVGPKVHSYGGFYTSFNVVPVMGGILPDVPFFWNTSAGPSTSHLPYDAYCYVLSASASGCPSSATAPLGGGHEVSIVWTKEGTTFWVRFSFS